MRRVLAGTLVALLLGAASQVPPAAAESADDCGNAGTTQEIAACFGRIYDKADAKLNALYRKLQDGLADPGERTMLQAAERIWTEYRDKECDFETAGTRQGTIHATVVAVCLTEKTEAHAKELQRQLNCGDGDTGCVHELRQQ